MHTPSFNTTVHTHVFCVMSNYFKVKLFNILLINKLYLQYFDGITKVFFDCDFDQYTLTVLLLFLNIQILDLDKNLFSFLNDTPMSTYEIPPC